MERQHLYAIWLQKVLSVKCDRLREITDAFSTPEEIFEASEMDLKISGVFTRAEINRIAERNLTEAEEIMRRCRELDIEILSYFDEAYPVTLKNIKDPPIVLYVKGRMPQLQDRLKVAMVGTREPTLLGKQTAFEFSYQLTRRNVCIISGGAEGIDTESHRGAMLAGGQTICVLGGGINHPYPKHGKRLREEIARRGALVSEYPPDQAPKLYSYPDRNRIISALSDAVVVVEAGSKSGTLITAAYAAEQNKPVFAVPGNIDKPASFGTNGLIAMGAGVITRYEMLLDWYCTDKRTADRLGQTFTAENIKMLRYLDYTEPIPYVRGIGMLYPPPQKYLEEKNKSSKDDKEAENSNKKTAGSKRLFSIQPDEKDSEAIKKQAEKQKTAVEQLTETLRTVYDTISETPKNAIQISAELSMNSYEVLALLTELELNGLIVHQGYGQYIRK